MDHGSVPIDEVVRYSIRMSATVTVLEKMQAACRGVGVSGRLHV